MKFILIFGALLTAVLLLVAGSVATSPGRNMVDTAAGVFLSALLTAVITILSLIVVLIIP